MIIINGSFLLNNLTGVERYAIELVKLLPKHYQGHEIVLIAPKETGVKNELSVKIAYDNWKISGQRWLWEQTRLPRLLYKYSNYILWSPANTGPYFIKNQVLTIHDVAFLKEEEWFSAPNRIFYRMLIPNLAKKVSHILTVSQFSKKELVNHGVAEQEKIDVIYNSSGELFRNHSNERNPGDYFVTIGSRDPRKNIGTLIKTWKILNDRNENFPKLKIIGKGNRGFKEEGISEIPDNVDFTGYLSDGEMVNLLQNSKALIFPSLYEGFGLPPLEAMSMGVPVICSDIAPLREVCGDAPVYFNPLDNKEIAQKIEKFLNEPYKSSEMISKGLERSKLYSWKKSADKLLSILDRVYE
jgi:glycosyltransferase involved in cell wall biosynthesis